MNQQPFQFALDASANLDQLIADVCLGKSGPYPVPEKARALLRILEWHKGASHARPLAEIAAKLDVSERELKALVKELVEQFGVPIGASRQEPYGYFLCVSAGDFEIALRPYIHEIKSLARRVRALNPDGRLAEILGQLQLQLDEKAS